MIAEPSVGVVIPAYREKETISHLVQSVLSLPMVRHVVVVDDTPGFETVQALESYKTDPRVRVIHRAAKGGRGSAVIRGFEELHRLPDPLNVVLEMDADFSHDPAEIPTVVGKLQQTRAGLIVASRYLPESQILNWPLKRRLFSRAANSLARFLLRVPISDYTNGFRAYSMGAVRQVLQEPLLGSGFIALSDILVRVYYGGFAVSETPSIFRNRIRGESSVSRAEIWNAISGLWRIYLSLPRIKRETIPVGVSPVQN